MSMINLNKSVDSVKETFSSTVILKKRGIKNNIEIGFKITLKKCGYATSDSVFTELKESVEIDNVKVTCIIKLKLGRL